jgi:Fur family peroxide stress response transcriptional regulator
LPQQRLVEFEQKCREKGLALTVQRRVILGELVLREDHPTADQIFDVVRDRIPGLSRTTVYRVLDTLVQCGVARKVAHADAVVRFDPNVERHHHLFCEQCGKLEDVDAADVGRVKLPRNHGFTITNFSVNYTGICQACRAKTEVRSQKNG